MKKLLILLLLALPVAAQAQKNMVTFDQLKKKYTAEEGYTVVELTEGLMKLSGIGGADGIRDIRIITAEKPSDDFAKDIDSVVKEGGIYEKLAEVNEKEQSARFYYRSNYGRITEFVMTITGGESLIMSIRGDFSIEQIRSIAGKMGSQKGVNIKL